MGSSSTTSLGANALDSDFNALTGAPGLYPGGAGTSSIYNANSEGGFVTSHGDSKWGFYVGRKSQFTTLARSISGFLGQENTIEAMYGLKVGDLAWGASVNYSASDKKALSQKQTAAGIRLGVVATNWDAFAVIGLSSSADGAVKAAGTVPAGPLAGTYNAINDTTATYRGTAGYKFGGGYWLNSMYINANYYQDGAKATYAPGSAPGGAYVTKGFLGANNDIGQKHWEVGVIDTIKNENSTFFYGGYYAMDNAENKEAAAAADAYKLDKQTLPFLIGMEVQATSWLTLRGSVKQNVILSSKKSQGNDANTVDNSTTAGAGVGMKWNKVNVDAMIAKTAAGTSGDINENNLLSNASITYWF